MSKRQGIETVKANGVEYKFKMDFDALARIEEELSVNLITMFSGLVENVLPASNVIKVILTETIQSDNKKDDIEAILIDFGFQECWALGYTLLSHGMIGDKKKRNLTRKMLMQEAFDSVLMNIGLAPWRLVLMIVTFGGSICGLISLLLKLSS